ncbi:hypothetical protein DFP72DRAFT_905665 [Ephemerocybe angulata]|uniref:Uncharacterized protein n=1 Tax=Ephemerocybe angulata TaxID=980116 RepID=A0A8H6M4X0_9AGAR|nr:hypothetical protein DFP72DRAFT_905665 [Tulosesus angulatus]
MVSLASLQIEASCLLLSFVRSFVMVAFESSFVRTSGRLFAPSARFYVRRIHNAFMSFSRFLQFVYARPSVSFPKQLYIRDL